MDPARVAVSALFFSNGLLVGSWAPKIPTLMARLQIDEAMAGLIVLGLGLGSIAMMPVFGALTARRGSAFAVRLAALLTIPSLIWISIAPGFVSVALAVALFGGLIGGMDVPMNANAVAVERVRRRAIMSSCHGFWSLGALVGSGAGGWLILRMGEFAHSVLMSALFAAILAFALPRILQDAPEPDAARVPLRLPSSPLPYLLGLVALCSMISEGAILDWAAVYLEREMGASLAVAGWGFAACAGTMAVMRFLGDDIRRRFGAVKTLRISAVVAMIGLVIAGAAPVPGMAIAGFAITGLGVANMVPIAFSAAGNVPGLAAGMGLSVVTMMGYSGILLAPASIGFVAERTGFSVVYLALAGLVLIPLFLSHLVRMADFDAG
ncbi:MFS transporter [Paracoccus sp. (in: a-proteobacteria)]|uniref:MFS transporter n=1 Tax=Paracoccus sp. TaxID=267 RepID=UPI0026E01CA4|nr:MFS transporter [Paracoccus sp. (in: a-proteobacteria)]MDO5646463.1 MFS transporter [Paracoccus sp. (in: a-proteobacteria)]